MATKVNNVEVIRQIADKEGIPFEDVLEAVKHQFRSVKETMQKGEHQTIRLPFFGKFHVEPRRLAQILRKATIRSQGSTDSDDTLEL